VEKNYNESRFLILDKKGLVKKHRLNKSKLTDCNGRRFLHMSRTYFVLGEGDSEWESDNGIKNSLSGPEAEVGINTFTDVEEAWRTERLLQQRQEMFSNRCWRNFYDTVKVGLGGPDDNYRNELKPGFRTGLVNHQKSILRTLSELDSGYYHEDRYFLMESLSVIQDAVDRSDGNSIDAAKPVGVYAPSSDTKG
tara:strand:+ start:828 stop:1409 length:582 start_codon:yes stop_codon:yes gene_type:complete